jgi:acetyltransferase-like isoleucine patch superfamily enzyme
MATTKPTSLIGIALWALRRRPAHVLIRSFRGLLVFHMSAWIRKIFPPQGVEFARNVRLQKNHSVMAEAPDGRILLGDDTVVFENAKLEAYGRGRIEIGAESILGDIKIVSRYRIQIGARFLSSWNVFIQDFDPHPTDPALRALQVADMALSFRPNFAPAPDRSAIQAWRSQSWNFPGDEIIIGDNVWVGANATILKGARIGSGCIVATGAVVLRGEYPPNSVLGGNPAKVVRTQNAPSGL